MLQNLYPDCEEASAYQIDYQAFYDRGYRGILFDVDNTLVEHDQPVTERAVALFGELARIGFHICIISNNKEERVKPLADTLGSEYIHKAGKPSARGFLAGMEKMGTTPETTLFVGDQIFTDIWGANRAGVYSVLVKQIAKHEEIQIVLKRYLEKPVLFLAREEQRRNAKKSR